MSGFVFFLRLYTHNLTYNKINPKVVSVFIVSLWLYVTGAGFFLARKNIGGMLDHSFIPRLRFFFFFKVEISSRTLIPLFMPDHSTVAQQAEKTVAECSLSSCV